MSDPIYQKAYREYHREKLNAYKKAHMRLKRGNPDFPPEFPKEIKNVSRGAFKPRKKVERKIPNNKCQRCESLLKGEINLCSWCSKR